MCEAHGRAYACTPLLVGAPTDMLLSIGTHTGGTCGEGPQLVSRRRR